MKKIYLDPEMEVVELKVASAILVGSDPVNTEGGSSDTEYTGGSSSSDDPGFGGKY